MVRCLVVFGLVILVGIVLSVDVKNGIKSKLKKEHDHKNKLIGHNPHSVRSPPLVQKGQKHFMRYLNQWRKFSHPDAKWNQEHDSKKIQRKIHNVKKGNEKQPESIGRLKHKLFPTKKQGKTSRLDSRRWNKFSRKGKFNDMKERFSSRRQHIEDSGKRMNTLRRKGVFGNKKDLEHKKKFGIKRENGKEHKETIKGNRRNWHREMHRRGRPANGKNPFGRGSSNVSGGKNAFCMKKQNKRCSNYKYEVCGSDGKTYQNKCLFVKEMCKKGAKSDMKIVRRGACEEKMLH